MRPSGTIRQTGRQSLGDVARTRTLGGSSLCPNAYTSFLPLWRMLCVHSAGENHALGLRVPGLGQGSFKHCQEDSATTGSGLLPAFGPAHLPGNLRCGKNSRMIGRAPSAVQVENHDVAALENAQGHFRQFLTLREYEAPQWACGLNLVPTKQLTLGHLPTPIHRWNVPGLPKGTQLYIKRDDLTGMELSGNKVRKLEFLLAEALAKGADCVVTIGGIQSNHCRATAVAARYLGLDTHLILRTSKALVESDPGLVGNLLVERLAGAQVHLVSKEEYAQHGSSALGKKLVEQLEAEGRRPYLIPVGGSNGLGTWGYVEAVREIEAQLAAGNAGGARGFDDIVMACGSGGTTAGLALGSHLSGMRARVWAYGVCDTPDYFYDFIQGLLGEVGSAATVREVVTVRDAKGLGYALSTESELRNVSDVAAATGILLDPVYSGKALVGLLEDMSRDPGKWEGRAVLFVHTGGLLGMYDKLQQLQPLVGSWERMSL